MGCVHCSNVDPNSLFTVLDHATVFSDLAIKEALYIKRLDPKLNKLLKSADHSYTLKLFS